MRPIHFDGAAVCDILGCSVDVATTYSMKETKRVDQFFEIPVTRTEESKTRMMNSGIRHTRSQYPVLASGQKGLHNGNSVLAP